MKMDEKGQTSIEYLLIVSVLLLIVASASSIAIQIKKIGVAMDSRALEYKSAVISKM